MGWQGSSITVQEGDRVVIRSADVYPIPTGHEVKLLFETAEEGTPICVALGIMAHCGLRPIENARQPWSGIALNKEQRPCNLRHLAYKPSNRRSHTSTSYYFKELNKDIKSLWLQNQIVLLAKRSEKYKDNRMFPWTTDDAIAKHFSDLRHAIKKGKYPEEYGVFLEQMTKTIYGTCKDQYRISPYSLRRFAMTFWHYTNGADPIKTAKYFGHSNHSTTTNHYLYPKEAIGLTQEMIDAKVTFDEFVHLHGKKQMQLLHFDPTWQQRFLPVGQSSLNQFQF